MVRRNKNRNLSRSLEGSRCRRRQFLMGEGMLVEEIAVNHHLITKPFVAEIGESTPSLRLGIGLRELIEVKDRASERRISVSGSWSQAVGEKRSMTEGCSSRPEIWSTRSQHGIVA